ncbi:hypothetical protein DFH09DRAFT_1282491 [Mycena vulgaris]|nr:hypothetical protein DFH09DRAFT_1282491 [Mycena vulgaris]
MNHSIIATASRTRSIRVSASRDRRKPAARSAAPLRTHACRVRLGLGAARHGRACIIHIAGQMQINRLFRTRAAAGVHTGNLQGEEARGRREGCVAARKPEGAVWTYVHRAAQRLDPWGMRGGGGIEAPTGVQTEDARRARPALRSGETSRAEPRRDADEGRSVAGGWARVWRVEGEYWERRRGVRAAAAHSRMVYPPRSPPSPASISRGSQNAACAPNHSTKDVKRLLTAADAVPEDKALSLIPVLYTLKAPNYLPRVPDVDTTDRRQIGGILRLIYRIIPFPLRTCGPLLHQLLLFAGRLHDKTGAAPFIRAEPGFHFTAARVAGSRSLWRVGRRRHGLSNSTAFEELLDGVGALDRLSILVPQELDPLFIALRDHDTVPVLTAACLGALELIFSDISGCRWLPSALKKGLLLAVVSASQLHPEDHIRDHLTFLVALMSATSVYYGIPPASKNHYEGSMLTSLLRRSRLRKYTSSASGWQICQSIGAMTITGAHAPRTGPSPSMTETLSRARAGIPPCAGAPRLLHRQRRQKAVALRRSPDSGALVTQFDYTIGPVSITVHGEDDESLRAYGEE